jgi:peptidoglycan hydrolase-like protein with peptidoglycan-binding domain
MYDKKPTHLRSDSTDGGAIQVSPGKRPLVDPHVQRAPSVATRQAHSEPVEREATDWTNSPLTHAALGFETSMVQRKAAGGGQTRVHHAAARGVEGTASRLPFLGRIQSSFGKHDVSGINSHTGNEASAACEEIGAQAYATGNSVAFGKQPDLHTAAHEAAHVVQQRGGVQLSGGVGRSGDVYEQNADAVADRVVEGASSEDLLDPFSSSSTRSTVQRRARRTSYDGQDELQRKESPDKRSAPAQPSLKVGASGASVTDLQSLLNEHGAGIATDGAFGPLTKTAVIKFQSRNRLTKDGIVGPATWARLRKEPKTKPTKGQNQTNKTKPVGETVSGPVTDQKSSQSDRNEPSPNNDKGPSTTKPPTPDMMHDVMQAPGNVTNRSPSRADLVFRKMFKVGFPKILASFPKNVETLFSSQQKLLLKLFLGTKKLPASFFTANDAPGLTIDLKILLSGAMHILDQRTVVRRNGVTQRVAGALNCGDWAQRVWEYAGIRTARGQRLKGVKPENRHGMPKDYREIRKRQDRAVSQAEFQAITPGKWIMVKWRKDRRNVANHSVLFLKWLVKPTRTSPKRGKALVMDQTDNTKTGGGYSSYWIGCETHKRGYVYAIMSAKPVAKRTP